MPKISEGGGPTHAGVTSTPTEEQYNDAMSRHGTAEWTEADQRVKDLWDESREEQTRVEKERSEQRSPGSSSSASSDKDKTSNEKTDSGPQQPARTTASPSDKDRTESSSVRPTGGPGTASKSTGDKK